MTNPFYFGWAAVAPEYAWPSHFIHVSSVSYTRIEAQSYIGEAWAHDGETPAQGWKRAYRRGWRCRRVAVKLGDEA